MFEMLLITITILVLLYALIKDLVTPSIAFVGAVAVALIANIITPEEALSGFSNPVLFIIASLFIIAKALQKSVNTGKLVTKILGRTNNQHYTLARLTVPVAASSGFIANTPIVASLIQPIEQWAKQNRISVSKLLMPLSFAAILGGLLTLTGTSTNLVVSGLLAEAGHAPMGFFEITKLGAPVALVGILTLIVLLPRMLPERKSAAKKESLRSSVVEYVATETIAGKSVRNAGLRNLSKLYLASIIRKQGDIIAPVTPQTVLDAGDTLQFVGEIKDIVGLQEFPGLKLKVEKHQRKLGLKNSTLYEVVLGHDSPVINKTLKQVNFRGYYQSAVFAVHRSGERIKGKLGDIKLKVGDTLLLVSDDYFEDRWSGERDFLLVSKMEDSKNINKQNLYKLSGILLVGLILAGFGADLLTILLTAAVLAVLSSVVTVNEARRAIDFDLLILIAASISFAGAVFNSGLSDKIASGLVGLFGDFGVYGLLLAVIVGSLILTELITNTASASLLFPVVLASAASIGADPRMFALVLAVACSLSFLSPLGYQTNTMVFGPGGYKFTDYIRVGSVLTLTTASTLFVAASMLL
jgi:di/tricarboxylate transporter